jgi:hypothetical protein
MLGGESVAQGCENLPPVAGLKESLSWAWAQAQAPSFYVEFESALMYFGTQCIVQKSKIF